MQENDRLEEAPSQAHLALPLQDGTAIAIKPGTVIMLIEDPSRADRIFQLVLRKVHHRYLDFDAVSADRKSTRRVRFRADWKGKHESPHKTEQENAMQFKP